MGPARTKAATLSETEKQQLAALGYATWTEIDEPEQVGVTLNEAAAQKGISYYCSESSGTVRFLGMDGEVFHTISVDISHISAVSNKCKLIEFDREGGGVMLIEDHELVSVDFASNVRWKKKGWFHHDVDIMDDGTMVVLSASGDKIYPAFDAYAPVVDNHFLTLDSIGNVIRDLSIASIVQEEPTLVQRALEHAEHMRRDFKQLKMNPRDVFHINSVEVVRKRVAYEGGLVFEPGDLLFCSRHLDTIGVIDPTTQRIKWHWGISKVEWPHHATLLDDGTIMLFDNGRWAGRSRILVVAPATGEIVWKYQATPPGSFFSKSRGSNQLLPNGNVLITDSDRGRAFEVTAEGKKVWEFWNTDLRADKKARSTIYRMARLTAEQVAALPFPKRAKQKMKARGYP